MEIERQLAAMDNDHPVGHSLHFLQDMRRDHHGRVLRKTPDQRPHMADLGRVEAVGRLVEDDDLRPVQDRLCDADALPVAARERGDRIGGFLAKLGGGDRLAQPRRPRLHRNAAQLGRVVEEVDNSHLGVKRAILRQIADPLLRLGAVRLDVMTIDGHGAGGRLEKASQDLHDRRLAGAVMAEQPDDLAVRDSRS